MKFVLVHNFYQQQGGEDAVFELEKNLLMTAGHQVGEYGRHNSEIEEYGIWPKATLGFRAIWAWDSIRELRQVLRRERPDLVHFHNIFPLISPAAYYACREEGLPVVQTLHNYRLLCPAASLFRTGHICEECLQHSLWRAVHYGCYRGSRSATVPVALMQAVHRRKQTWTHMVDCYIAPTEFARKKLIEASLPADKIIVKPNFVHPDPGLRDGPGEYVLFIGRLSPEKGLRTLLAAWARLGNRIPLRIIGDGPLRATLKFEASQHGLSTISFEGRKTYSEAIAALKRARFLAFPSEWYETFGRTVAEAFACGVPVLASRRGVMEEIVENGRTGLHFTPADPDDLAEKVDWAWTHPDRLEEMGREARVEYEAKYSAERNYEMLMWVYQRAIAIRRAA